MKKTVIKTIIKNLARSNEYAARAALDELQTEDERNEARRIFRAVGIDAEKIPPRELERMRAAAGWRELYAMTNGAPLIREEGGRRLVVWTLAADDEKQNASGAAWDIDARAWVN